MKIINLKIGTQLTIWLSILVSFVIALGGISFYQTNKIHRQIILMFEHPMQVRMAIGEVHSDVYLIHWALETAVNQHTYDNMLPYLETINESEARMQKNFVILREFYLGPKEDIEQLQQVTLGCKLNRDQVIRLIQAGNMEGASEINIHMGSVIGGDHLNEIIQRVEKISHFAKSKAETFRIESQELNAKLNLHLSIFVAVFLFSALFISYLLLQNIRKPLITLTRATSAFRNGMLDARSNYSSKNELGVLSESINALADSVQASYEFNKNSTHLADLMLSEDDAKKFFQTTLKSIAGLTGSQMIAAYLLSDDNKKLDHFYSIGLNSEARQSFDLESLEGEFGKALATGEIQHLTAIDQKTRFVFQAVSGDVIPGAIITIPIVASGDVLAIISMASLNDYSDQSFRFVQKIHNTLNARVAGILSFKRMIDFSTKLEEQNHELESQKTELFQQAAELGRQNAELEMQKQQLNEANRLKTSFLSNMSHELRTPLNSVIALSGVLNRRLASKISEEENSYIKVIERNGKLLLSLINDILDISRIESGREEVELSQFNICDQVNDVVNTIQPQACEKNITLTNASGDCEMKINSDVKKFHHILQNLIGNAVKFTETGGVSITVKKLSDTIQVNVTDSGIGIDAVHLPHIFDEFRQADGSTSRKFGGTGLGLAIAKKYAALLGGTISVESTPGVGSVFTLKLPFSFVNPDSTSQTPTHAASRISKIDYPETPETTSSTKTILLVEDSKPAIIQLKDILEEAGFEILVAEDGAKALEIVAQKTLPDCVILDLMMPGIDGFEVLRKLRESERTRRLPVLILTAKHISKEDMDVLRYNNIYQLIQKGDVNRSELLQAVKGMVYTAENKTEFAAKPLSAIEGKPKLLVVEDNPDNMLTVKALLSHDFEVIEAVDGNQAVEMAAKHLPNLILMDIALPEMDGIDAFKAIRSNMKLHNIPIIALTASAMVSDREVILAYGFDAYIPKPIDEQVFFKTINETLYGV